MSSRSLSLSPVPDSTAGGFMSVIVKPATTIQVAPEFTVKGVRQFAVPAEHLDALLARRVAGLHMIAGDLNRAKHLLTHLSTIAAQLEPGNADQAASMEELLWHASTLAYARCFRSSKKRGAMLHDHDLGCLSEKLRARHAQLKRMTHDYLAHASSDEHDRAITFVLLAPPPMLPTVTDIGIGRVTMIGENQEAYAESITLIDVVLAIVEAKIREATSRLLQTATDRLPDAYSLATSSS